MKHIITLILLFLLRLLTAQSLPDTLTLTHLRELAQERALEVVRAERNEILAVLDQEIYQAQVKPRLDLTANLPNFFSSFNETVQPDGTVAFRPVSINNSFAQLQLTQQLTATGGTLFLRSNLQRFDDFENDQSNYNGIPLRLGIIQPLLGGFNTWKWQKQILPLAQQETIALHKAEKEGAAAEATRLFFNLAFAQQDRQIALTNQSANERLYKIAQERYELGKINRGDLVQLELELAASGQNLIRADRSLATASSAIYQYLGWTYTGANLYAATAEIPQVGQVELEQALRLAASQRPEVLTSLRQELVARREMERVRKGNGPQINLNASIGLVRSDLELSKIYSDPQAEQIISIQFQVPILDWGERRKLNKQMETQLAFAQTQNERVINDLNSQVTLIVNQWNALGEELELADRIRSLAEDRFNISSESYLLGSIPLTDLTLAQQNRDLLARAYLNTLSTYWLTYAELQRLTLYDFVANKSL